MSCVMNSRSVFKSRFMSILGRKSIILNSMLNMGNVLKRIFIDTILIHIFASFLNIFLTFLRDKYIKEICWSEKPECKCEFYYTWFYLFFGVIIQFLCPLCICSSLIFGLMPQLMSKSSSKFILIFGVLVFSCGPYTYAYYFLIGSPRLYSYAIYLFFACLFSLIYIRRMLKCTFKTYLHKMKYLYFFTFSSILYLIIVIYVGPVSYQLLASFTKQNTKNVFQLISLLVTALYETLLSYLFIKLSKQLVETGDLTFLILLAKYYYIVLYTLRIGNILYLESTDWGFYLQFLCFFIFIFQHTTGISIFSTFFLLPFAQRFLKQVKSLRYYIHYNSKVLNTWRKWLQAKGKVTPLRRHKISFSSPDIIKKHKQILELAQKKAFLILCYQNFEFILIYVPTLLFLWLYRSWKGPEPFYMFTVGCSFEVTNIAFQGYSIISLIVIDLISSAGFTGFMYYKGKLNEFHDNEKIGWFLRVLIFMGYQLTFEYWMSHFSSYQLMVDLSD